MLDSLQTVVPVQIFNEHAKCFASWRRKGVTDQVGVQNRRRLPAYMDSDVAVGTDDASARGGKEGCFYYTLHFQSAKHRRLQGPGHVSRDCAIAAQDN
ncbi:hypothetical protein [Pseudomonas sp. dw_358]|uniref:hypothetical protein n=1 Tax=Pseudomonas sp. dw_358 TaxID=2720083 RepID=UPI00211687AF|nr:hypothetical protein [Pseudomonas sp. dw_358]